MSQALAMRRSRVSAFFPQVIQRIQFLGARGVRLDHCAHAPGAAANAFRRSPDPHGLDAPVAPDCKGRRGTVADIKKAETLVLFGVPAFVGRSETVKWWRWGELNPRPKALHPRHYMLSAPLGLVSEQHGARSASGDQPVLVNRGLTGNCPQRFRDNDPTSTSTGTSGFGAYALSGESVVVVVGN